MAKKNILVQWKGTGIHDIQYGVPKDDAGNYRSAHVRLMPGHNQVSIEDWAKVKDNPVVKHYIEDDKIIVAKSAEFSDEESPLKGMTEQRAIKVVKETAVKETLEAWHAVETRGPVMAAIEMQIKELTQPIVSEKPTGKGSEK